MAEPAHSATCPTQLGHSHMGHGDMSSSVANPDNAMQHKLTEKLANAQCSSCHGTDGMGISDNIPSLAGQESMYMCGWLAGCREQGEQCDGHEDIAAKLTNQEIVDFAEYYSRLPSKKW